mmetsp:Transcript_33812/g.63194  ORF Transcript_33812/g.63194 Transcript_33812/m.63194 type:complete len:453 (+) Transcript_33812:261-1619(+)
MPIEQALLVGALSEPLDSAAVQVVDAALNLHLAGLHLVPDGGAVCHQEVHGVEDVNLHRVRGDILLAGLTPELVKGLLRHAVETLEQGSESARRLLHRGLALRGEEVLRGPFDGAALRVTENQNQLAAKSPCAELEAAHDATLGMHAGVACVPQHEQVPGKGVEDELQWHARVCATEDGSVGSLSDRGQCAPHLCIDAPRHGSAHREAFVALLQQLQGSLGHQGRVFGGAHAVGAEEGQAIRGPGHGRREMQLGCQELRLLGGRSEEVNFARLQFVHCAVDLEVPGASELADGLRKLQQEVNGVEDVHLDGSCRQLLGARLPTQLLGSLRSNGRQALKQALESTARRLGVGSLLLGQVSAGSSGQCATVGVAHDHNQSASKLSHAELQATDEAALRVRASVARVAQNKKIARGSVENGFHGRTGIGTPDDGRVRRLPFLHQGSPVVSSCRCG